MPLFECSKCQVIDNTALTNFWHTLIEPFGPALCSQCDPEIGVWHGEFPRTPYTEFVAKHGAEAVEYPVKRTRTKA